MRGRWPCARQRASPASPASLALRVPSVLAPRVVGLQLARLPVLVLLLLLSALLVLLLLLLLLLVLVLLLLALLRGAHGARPSCRSL